MKATKVLFNSFMTLAVIWLLNSPFSVFAQAKDSPKQNGKQSIQPSGLAGPEGVAQKLESEEAPNSIFPQPSGLKSYDAWKNRLKDAYGLSFGLSAYLLYRAE
jgi:hypothetical protein